MVRQTQRHRETVLPFRYRENGLNLAVEALSIDGRKPRDVELKPGERSIDVAPTSLSQPTEDQWEANRWNRITIFGRIEVPQSLVDAVFPSSEREAPPAKLYIAKRCHETIYRDSVNVRAAPVEPGVYDVRLNINWEVVRGSVELRPYLVRTKESDSDEDYASKPNVRVASGDRFEIVVDHWDSEEPAAIDGEEASFSASDHLPGEEKLYHLDFRNGSRPKLWLNADHPRITDVLQTGGSVGAEPRLRDVILDEISYGVWTQLILRTAAAMDRDGEVEYEWQQNVIESFVRDIYDVDDSTQAAYRLREEFDGGAGLGALIGKIDHELQDYLDPRQQLINLMEEGLQL